MARLPKVKKQADKAVIKVLRGIFTAEENALLELWLPKYLLLKRMHGKKFVAFWEPLYEQYFNEHPLPPLTPQEIASGVDQGERRGNRMLFIKQVSHHNMIILCVPITHHYIQRIREWFNNHTRVATSGKGRRVLLDLVKASKPRKLSAYHAYSAMNKDRIGPIIDQEWVNSVLLQRHTDKEKAMAMPPVPIAFRNATLKRLLKAEPPSVQADVETWRQTRQTPEVKIDEEVDEETARLAKADQYHQ